jgi:hypothetical protein
MDNKTWFEKLIVKFWQWLANRLPDSLVYFAVLRAVAYARERKGQGLMYLKVDEDEIIGYWHTRRHKEIG